jgi:glycosyltransferase involved in cell wall biosynthesis
MDGVTIIVPVYNEEKYICECISKLNAVILGLEKKGIKTEVLYINDGSTDQTRDLLEKQTAQNTYIVINHAANRGYGAALKTGVRNASYDALCIIDADGTYPFHKIPELIEAYRNDKHDMVVGARINENVNIPWVRRPAKWFLTVLASFLAGIHIPDLNSGLRVMKACVVEKYLRIMPNGFSFTSTITLAMLTNDYQVLYMPIDYYERKGKSKIRPIQDTMNFLQLILRMILYFDPLKIFLPLCLPILVFGFGLIAYQALVLHDIGTVSVIISLAGIQLLAIGMIADIIDKRMG